MRIVAFDPDHCTRAADLVSARIRAVAERTPLLPTRLRDAASVVPLLERLAGEGLGVAAVDGARLGGFLLPMGIPMWGAQAAYVPEWAHAGAPNTAVALYTAASRRWVERGRRLHAITLWVGDPASESAWHHMGFGRTTCSGIGPT